MQPYRFNPTTNKELEMSEQQEETQVDATTEAATEVEAMGVTETKPSTAKMPPEKSGGNKARQKQEIKPPKPETACGKLWTLFDTLAAKLEKKSDAKREAFTAEGDKLGMNPSTVRTQYANWRSFNGLGKEERKVREAKPKAPKPEKAEKAPKPEEAPVEKKVPPKADPKPKGEVLKTGPKAAVRPAAERKDAKTPAKAAPKAPAKAPAKAPVKKVGAAKPVVKTM